MSLIKKRSIRNFSFSAATRTRIVAVLLLGVFVPLTAWSLTLSDYFNESTVVSSSDQFEPDTDNNVDGVQITPNAELVVVKQIINDNGGAATLADFTVATDAGTLVFDAGVVAGTTTTFTAETLYIPPGSYSLTELDIDGYTEGSWSCTVGTVDDAAFDSGQVTLAFGEQTVCTIINDDIAPTLTLTKKLVNDNGGVSTIEDFDISIDSAVVASGVANTVLANTAIQISELDLPGYTEGTWACTDANGLTSGLPTVGAATGQTLKLKPGSEVTCAITNDDVAPSLTLTKSLTNDNGGDKTIADFDIAIDGIEVVSGASNLVAANTGIVISELVLDGYTAGNWVCSDSTGLTTGLPTAGVASGETIKLAEGAVVDCKISNDDIAPLLTLTKTVVNNDGGLLTSSDFDIAIDGVEVASAAVNTVLANVDIEISELDLPGYTEGAWVCTDANGLTTTLPDAGSATSTTVNLLPGSDVTCAISNDDLAPTLTLSKKLLNDDGGDLTEADFGLSVDGVEVANGAANTVSSNVDIEISELDMPGYTEGTWSCSDSTGLTTTLPTAGIATGEVISLAAGAVVECVIINDDIAPTLTLNKNLINDNGGDKLVTDFDISIDGVEVAAGSVNTVTANQPILISELSIAGYTAGTWACTDSTGLTTALPTAGAAVGESITLEPGSKVVCEITNDDIAPTLTLAKTVVNDNGGDKLVEDFDIAIDGVEVVNGTPTTVLANTVIKISELDLVPYSEGTWACTDANGLTTGLPNAGLATGTDITLLPGSDVTCSITNNDLGIDLSIVKSVDDSTPNIGQIITFSLDVTNAGPDVATNVSVADPVPVGFTYVPASITGGDSSTDADPTVGGLAWTLNSVPVGSTVTLTFQATVNAP